jgi:hypothetical protein
MIMKLLVVINLTNTPRKEEPVYNTANEAHNIFQHQYHGATLWTQAMFEFDL